MTKPLAADPKLFLALSSCDVPRDLADRVQQRCKLPDVVAAANQVVKHSLHDQWQARAKGLRLLTLCSRVRFSGAGLT